MHRKFITLYFLLAFCSCQHHPAPESPGQRYFPLDPGTYSEFRVERIRLGSSSTDTSRHKVRRLTESPLLAGGEEIFPLQYQSEDTYGSWKTDSVTSGWITPDKAFEQESGKPVIKMFFPLSERLKWKCNTYNIGDPAESIALQVNQPQHIAGRVYPLTVTIVRQDDSTLLSRKKYIETYAADVGLVKREQVYLRYCQSADCIGKGIIESGWKEVFILEKTGKQ